MHRLAPTTETLTPAPLDREAREKRVREILESEGLRASRTAHAASAGITITYAHFQTAGAARTATELLAANLDWDDTFIAWATSHSVAITTNRG